MIVGVVRNRPAHRMAWVLLIFGVGTFAAGDITYDVLTEFLHQSNPFPSIADAFYLATYLFLAAGLVTMVRNSSASRRRHRAAARCTHHHRRTRGVVVGLPDPAIRASGGHDAVCEADLGRLPGRRHTPALRSRPSRVRRQHEKHLDSPPRNRRRRRLGSGLLLRMDPAARLVEGGRADRPRLGLVLRRLGSGSAPSVDARPHGGAATTCPAAQPGHARVVEHHGTARAGADHLARR